MKNLSVFSQVKKIALFTHVKEHVQSTRGHTSWDAHGRPQRVHTDPCRTSWTWADNDFYITHSREDPCGHAGPKWPMLSTSWLGSLMAG